MSITGACQLVTIRTVLDRFRCNHSTLELELEDCQKRERCTRCKKIRCRKHFQKQDSALFLTCSTCQQHLTHWNFLSNFSVALTQIAGLRYCIVGWHKVQSEACFENDRLRAAMNNKTNNNDKQNKKMLRYGLLSMTGSGMMPYSGNCLDDLV